MSIYVSRIACEDRPGLVHQITGVLYKSSMNITENQEYVDHSARRFYTRLQFEGEDDAKALLARLKNVLPQPSYCELREMAPRRLLVFCSKEPHCVGDLLLRHSIKELSAQILAVISPNPDCEELTKRFGLPFHLIPVRNLDRAEHEELVLKVVREYKPDYLVLARYMRILTQNFIAQFPERILNIHHSFLPAFIGKNPYQQAYHRGVKIVGATSHFVTEDLDEGPIITQDVIAVDHTCSADEMAKRGRDVERLVLARALELVLDDRVLIDGNRTIVFK